MSSFSLKATHRLPIPRETAWDFFSSPQNLPLITPMEMGFRIISKHHGEKMYPGQIIEYTVKPLFGLKFYWMTEVTQVHPFDFFVDDQRYGPYNMWHHQHHFKEIEGGTEMTDLVHYRNPLGILGRWANPLLVRPKLKSIFEYRYRKIIERFGRWDNDEMQVIIS